MLTAQQLRLRVSFFFISMTIMLIIPITSPSDQQNYQDTNAACTDYHACTDTGLLANT